MQDFFNDFPKRQILKTVCFIGLTVTIANKFRRRKQNQRAYQKIQKAPVLSLDEALTQCEKLPKQTKSDQMLVKLKPVPSSVNIQLQRRISSNEVYLIEPSLNNMNSLALEKLRRTHNKKSIKKNSCFEFEERWQAWRQKYNKKPAKVSLQGFGEIIDDQIFQVQANYTPIKNIGILKKIHELFSYAFECVLFYRGLNNDLQKAKLGLDQKRRPFFKGPIIGTMLYHFNFLSNRNILVQASIRDGKVFPEIICGSKSILLRHFQNKMLMANIEILVCSVLNIMVYGSMYKFYKRKFKRIYESVKEYFQPKKIDRRRLREFVCNSDELNDEKLCIICFTNCRNTLIFNCRHLIMCRQCKNSYTKDVCPLCKSEIEDDKVIHA